MTQFSPFLSLLSEIGAPVEKLLEAAKLPRSVYDNPVGFVSAHSSWDFVNRAAKSQGIPDLGWRVIEEAVLGAVR
jgi:hypothetical protein